MNYYNEWDKYAAQWLRNLIAAGYLPPGDVDERDIRTVRPEDLEKYAQCHFFAGIGGWSLALKLAGWPDDRPVWTGSCPCQPFSAAGKRKGVADERHLWPDFLRLIAARRPPVVFGEQVSSDDGLEWLAGVRIDLAACGYAVGAADLCAASVGAPEMRQRLWWVADAKSIERRAGTGRNDGAAPRNGSGMGDPIQSRLERHARNGKGGGEPRRIGEEAAGSAPEAGVLGSMANPTGEGSPPRTYTGIHRGEKNTRARDGKSERCEPTSGLADSDGGVACDGGIQRRREYRQQQEDVLARRLADAMSTGRSEWRPEPGYGSLAGSGGNFWEAFDILYCTDEKFRPVEPGTFPLAHGVPARVGKLRAYGNAIVPQVAAEFVKAYLLE